MAKVGIKPSKRKNIAAALSGEINADNMEIMKSMEHAEKKTQNEVIEVLDADDPKPAKINTVVELVKNDNKLTKEEKKTITSKLNKLFTERYTLENCPSSPDELREEAKYLSKLNRASLILIAQRAKEIRDHKYYLEWDYNDFKAWVEGDLKLNRTTVYKYIDLFDFFGVEALRHSPSPSVLLPTIPLMRSKEITEIEKVSLRKTIIEESKLYSYREMEEKAKNLKLKHGLISENNNIKISEKIIDKDLKKIKAIRQAGNIPAILELKDESELKFLKKQLKIYREK